MFKKLIYVTLMGSTLVGCTFTERVADRMRETPLDAKPSTPVQKTCIAKGISGDNKLIEPNGVPVTITDYGDRFSLSFPRDGTWVVYRTFNSPKMMFTMSNNEYIYSSTPKETYMKGVGNQKGHYVVKMNYPEKSWVLTIAVYKCDS